MKKKKFSDFVTIFYGITICAMASLLFYLGVNDNIKTVQTRQDAGFRKIENYTCIETDCPDAPIGVVKEYSWIVEEMEKGDNCLAFYVVHQFVEVYLNDELIYSLMPSEQNKISKTIGSNWVMVPLYQEDTGKEIRIRVIPVYESFKDRKINFLVGSKHRMYLDRLKKDMPQLIVSMIAIVAGCVFIVVGLYNDYKEKQGNRLMSLGSFSLMLGLWRITDTRFTPLLFPDRPTLLLYISLAMLMLGSIPLMRSVRRDENGERNTLFQACYLIVSFVCMIQIILQILNIADFRETLFVTHIVIILSVAVLIVNAFHERHIHRGERRENISRNLMLICVIGVAADVAAFYFKGNSSGLLFTLASFVLYIIIYGIIMITEYLENEKRLKKQEAELADSRISIMLSQIQPHFLYNSLNTIYYLCEKDPGQAAKAICDFSEYLRGNLDSMKRKTPVPFETELQHIKVYLSLEKMRFAESLEIVYDIETTAFLVPALSVQPIVENAVKHGVGNMPEGGTVRIATKEYPHYFEVIVSDNGSGYDPDEQKEDGRSHIGIENVRDRLWKMSQAMLDITGEKGKGTTVRIKIPKTL